MFAALGVVAERLGYACAEVGGRAVVGAEAVAVFYEVLVAAVVLVAYAVGV